MCMQEVVYARGVRDRSSSGYACHKCLQTGNTYRAVVLDLTLTMYAGQRCMYYYHLVERVA